MFWFHLNMQYEWSNMKIVVFADRADVWRSTFRAQHDELGKCLNECQKSPLASRRAGDGPQRNNRAGEAWTGPNRWRVRRKRGVSRTRATYTNLTVQQQRERCVPLFFVPVFFLVCTHAAKQSGYLCPRFFFVRTRRARFWGSSYFILVYLV